MTPSIASLIARPLDTAAAWIPVRWNRATFFHGGNIMLVLARKLGETIVIDGDIRVTVLETKGDRVRLGIEAPPYVPVDRQEVHERRSQFADWVSPKSDTPLLHNGAVRNGEGVR
jgi:carbon storage regulator